jgi:hypothetical protein
MSVRSILRFVLALAASCVAWVVAFWIPIIAMTFFWPALRATGQAFWEQGRYDIFDTSMLVAFQLVWPVANAAAGLVARLIGKRQLEVYVAGLLFAYFAYNHLWALWGEMPDWYNVLVVIPVVPAVLVGGLIGQRIMRRR